MWWRRGVYLATLLGCLVFYGFYREWFSGLILCSVAVLPWFSLLISLPAMLTVKAEVRCPQSVRIQVPARSALKLTCKLPIPPINCRIRLHNSLTGSRFVGTPGELIPSEHCGCMHIHVDRLYVTDYLGLFRRNIRNHNSLCVYIEPKPVACILPEHRVNRNVRLWRPKSGGGFAENHDLRLYRPGDELHGIHWKMTAKTGKLIYREPIEPAQKGALLQLSLWGEPRLLDRKLGQLLWISDQLLCQQCAHEVRCYTGEGLIQAHIAHPDEIRQLMQKLLVSTCAAGEREEPAGDALWQYRIGGDDHEAG